MRLDRSLQPLFQSRVRLTDEFWTRRQQILSETTLAIQYAKCKETGRIENFKRAARGENGTFQGIYYNDSDVYKWVEAACWLRLARGGAEDADESLSEVVEAIAGAQMEDGYLNTYFQLQCPDLRWRNMAAMHEIYCAGHLLEAAVAHETAFGNGALLTVALRLADHVENVFGPGKRLGYCGHEEFEIGLLRLSSCPAVAQERQVRYRALAAWMIEARGRRPSLFAAELEDAEAQTLSPWMKTHLTTDGVYSGAYVQDHLPLSEQSEVQGHAVRAMYLFTAATEAYAGRGNTSMEAALERLWLNLSQRRMYVTGGIGSSALNEGFTRDYDLPNLNAYAETCAACGLVLWTSALLNSTADGQFAEIMELALYNGVLSGISRSGDRFFYANPLASNGEAQRKEWFDCACCPPNIARLIASVARYAFSSDGNDLYIHLPIGADLAHIVDGYETNLKIDAATPWNETFTIRFLTAPFQSFAIAILSPSWADSMEFILNGSHSEPTYERGYMTLRRSWRAGDCVEVRRRATSRWLSCHQEVLENAGRAALRHGPFIYCLEEIDLGANVSTFVADLSQSTQVQPGTADKPPTVQVRGAIEAPEGENLYFPAGHSASSPVTTSFVPYFTWNNRGQGSMQVWVRANC